MLAGGDECVDERLAVDALDFGRLGEGRAVLEGVAQDVLVEAERLGRRSEVHAAAEPTVRIRAEVAATAVGRPVRRCDRGRRLVLGARDAGYPEGAARGPAGGDGGGQGCGGEELATGHGVPLEVRVR